VAVGDMVSALRDVAGEEVAARVRWNYDPAIDRIVSTWPSNFAPKRGTALGMRADADFASVIRAYMADDMPRAAT
jgi:D-erythronate 2-dehydrogenase